MSLLTPAQVDRGIPGIPSPRRLAPAAVLAACVVLALTLTLSLATTAAAAAESKKIDLRTSDGVAAVKGQWRYSNVKIVEIPHKGPDGKPITTYGIEPRASGTDFDDHEWEVLDPTTLDKPRSTGRVCFCWYRIKVTIPEEARGKRVFFQTTVDDYGEVWVNGKLPAKVGQVGGAIVSGFNAPNRVELAGAEPGNTFQIAIFGINGPISAMPGNYIFLRATFLELMD